MADIATVMEPQMLQRMRMLFTIETAMQSTALWMGADASVDALLAALAFHPQLVNITRIAATESIENTVFWTHSLSPDTAYEVYLVKETAA